MSEPNREKIGNPEDAVLLVSSLHDSSYSSVSCEALTGSEIRFHSTEENGNVDTGQKRAPSQGSRSCHFPMMWIFLQILSGREVAEDEKRKQKKTDIKKARQRIAEEDWYWNFPRMNGKGWSNTHKHTHTQQMVPQCLLEIIEGGPQ